MKRYYIGLSVSTHDSALAILDSTGEILFAEATERYLQYKRAPNCEPDNQRLVSLLKRYCEPDAEFVAAVNWRKGTALFSRLLTALGITTAKSIFDSSDPDIKYKTPNSLRTKMVNAWAASMYDRVGVGLAYATKLAFPGARCEMRFFPHHHCHAALACYTSPYDEGCCLIADGAGDYGSFAFYRYDGISIDLIKEQKGFASLGHYYADMTWLCGFNPDKGEEWKVMGYAPYGRLDKAAYDLLNSVFQTSGYATKNLARRKYLAVIESLQSRIDEKRLKPADLAFTAQQVFTEVLLEVIDGFYDAYPSENLIMAGGCSLNSTTNGLILEQSRYKNLFIPSAPADDGTAVGAALLAIQQDQPDWQPKRQTHSPYLGSEMPVQRVQDLVRLSNNPKVTHYPGTVEVETAKLLAQGKLVGWAQGKAEFGPRSLGNRSILADPRPAEMKDKINSLVKFREEFRPFAPSILHEHGAEYFENYQETPYMERTLRFKAEVFGTVPAVVHVNGTGRLQTVKPEWNKKFYDLISAFYQLTGVPILLNTSFNVMGKPIVHSVEDAVSVFYTTGLDVLVIDDFLIKK